MRWDCVKSVVEPIDKTELLILAIETATRAGSVAVARGEQVLSSRAGDAAVSHSTNLIEMIQTVLHEAGATLSDTDFFATAVGPGSFTGLRIGLATIKGFATCTDRRVVGVSTLAAIARAAGESERTVALLPAGRGEVFAQMFSVADGTVRPLDSAAHLSPKELLKRYAGISDVSWVGEGVQKFKEHLSESGAWPGELVGTRNLETETPICLAASVAALARRDYREGKSVTAGELHAVYVRPSDAEINERWQQEKA